MPNPVYDDLLTVESGRRLAAIVQKLPEPVALCGGHAVRYRVRDEWKRQFNQEYFGSRDIDVAYHVRPDWTDEQLEESALGQAQLSDINPRALPEQPWQQRRTPAPRC